MRLAHIAFAALSLGLAALPADAALVISTAATANVKCTQGQYARVCTATANNAVLHAAMLANLLSSQNVNVSTGTATNDIVIDAPLSWASASGLGFIAQRSIVVNAHVSDAGTGTELSLQMGSGGQLSFGPHGSIGFWDTGSVLVIDNQGYQLVNSIASLATWVGNNPSGHFALAGNYDATPDGTYARAPIQPALTGTFEGLGNTISNLSINDQIAGDNVGLFAILQGGTIENLRLTRANIHASGNSSNPPYSYSAVGAVAGSDEGILFGDSVTGKIVASYAFAGGLTGGVSFGRIDSSRSATIVSDSGAGDVGGLAGFQTNSAPISGSCATGAVTGGDGMEIGGLVGSSFNSIHKSCATGAVTGGMSSNVGGLAGLMSGGIDNSHATGNVSVGDSSNAGGLAGYNLGGTISTSWASGGVSGTQGISGGGLVGSNGGFLKNTYAMGAVSSSSGGSLGGLAGGNSANINFPHSIQASYSTGHVSGDTGGANGGLIGTDTSQNVVRGYWDTTTSGIASPSQGAGSPTNDPGIAPRTTSQLRAGLPKGFSSSIWGEKSTVNNGLPYLLAVPPG